MENATYLTKQGLSEAKAELDYLVKTRRPEMVQLLKDVCPQRNSSAESERGFIRDEQAVVEKRIAELGALIKSAVIIEDTDTARVSVGAKAKLKFLNNNEIKTYSIVGTHEANPFKNKISNESPIARAILGKKVNDVATVDLGPKRFRIVVLGISAR